MYNCYVFVYCRDREIQFFELSSFEPYCQISGLETVPLKLDYRLVTWSLKLDYRLVTLSLKLDYMLVTLSLKLDATG